MPLTSRSTIVLGLASTLLLAAGAAVLVSAALADTHAPSPPAAQNPQGGPDAAAAKGKPSTVARHRPSPYCLGAYANDLVPLSLESRRVESKTRYTFCVRASATYQCLYYAPDGSVHIRKESSARHGTAFAYKRSGTTTYFVTNEHVSEFPLVTRTESPVDGVPPGCKRVSQTISIVDNESDHYAKDDLPLQRVVADPELDVSILKGQVRVELIPFALGQSSAIHAGDSVQVRGFPLSAFQAVSTGKVINPHSRDQEDRWDHVDLVVNAPLSPGNSGSPVLAVSCRTRSFELVGIYHAAYREGQSLNVVVGIDEFREMLTTLRPRKKTVAPAPSASDRRALVHAVARRLTSAFIPFAGYVVEIRIAQDRLLYDVHPRRFPLVEWRLAVLEDLPGPDFGTVGRIWYGSEFGLEEKPFSEHTVPEQAQVTRLLEEIRARALQVLHYRHLEVPAKKSRASYERLKALDLEMTRSDAGRKDLIRVFLDIAAHYAPGPSDRVVPLSATTAPPQTSEAAEPKAAGEEKPSAPAPAPDPAPAPAPGPEKLRPTQVTPGTRARAPRSTTKEMPTP
jgi:S1-C subfamily serine protease